MFINALVAMFAFLPSWVTILLIAIFALTFLIIIFKLIAFVLDSLPFL